VAAAVILPKIYKEQLRVGLEKEIDQKIDADVTFSNVDLQLLRHFPNLTLSFNNLLIKGKGEFLHDTLASVEDIQLEVKLWSWMSKGEIELKSIHLIRPEINIYVLKDGNANYDIAKSSIDSTTEPPKSFLKIAIDKISIEKGKITYSDWLRIFLRKP